MPAPIYQEEIEPEQRYFSRQVTALIATILIVALFLMLGFLAYSAFPRKEAKTEPQVSVAANQPAQVNPPAQEPSDLIMPDQTPQTPAPVAQEAPVMVQPAPQQAPPPVYEAPVYQGYNEPEKESRKDMPRGKFRGNIR